MGAVYWVGIQIQCSMQTHCFKNTFNLIWIKLKKYLIAEGSSGSNGWARVKSERTYSREPLLRTIFFDSRHDSRQRWNRLSKSLNCFANNADDECLLQPTRNWFLHTLDQDRLCDPALSTGRNDTEKTEFDEMINEFASIKARKVLLQVACCVI